MRLVVITDDGIVVEAVADIEDYNLSKALARAEVVDAVVGAVATAKVTVA